MKVKNKKVELFVCLNCREVEFPEDFDGECPDCGMMGTMVQRCFKKTIKLEKQTRS